MSEDARGKTAILDSERLDVATTVMAMSSDSEPAAVDPSPVSFEPGSRYATRRVLGAGGMGEVRLCADGWVGREVAMKVMRSGAGSHDGARARFVREARVQGQLEHPSVVPVYDLGRDEAGSEFFTMKRVKGHTLEEIVQAQRAGDGEMTAKYGRRKLLSAMSQVCLAVAYAHSRGVLHRDLKPANIMLGDFGEVYVLDWGIARIHGSEELASEERVVPDAVEIPETQVGALVGTPGYMSPEQARGETRGLTPASDIYSLGAILFELLSLEPLHRGKSVNALLASTLTQAPIAPSSWARDRAIAPELDAICVRATALEPEARFPSARALHETIERFLDGERDAEKRSELARAHLERARAALSGASDRAARAEGMRELSRALALDPSDPAALGMISDYVLGESEDLPAEAEAELKAVELTDRAAVAQRAALSYVSWFLGFPVAIWAGIRNLPLAATHTAGLVLLVAHTGWMAITGKAGSNHMRRTLVLNFVIVALMSTIFGPFVFTPGLAMASAAAYVVGIRANRQTRWLTFSLSFAAIFVPAALGWLGLLPRSYVFEDGMLKVFPWMLEFRPLPAEILLVAFTVGQLILPALILGRSIEALVRAERQNFAQAWRLRQLLPDVQVAPSLPPPGKCVI
ncbi:MAG: serine/threonine-protein kinase [Polyangiaceae bacterium]